MKGRSRSTALDTLIGILAAVTVLVAVLGGLYLYAGTWPPLSVVESQSMQHEAGVSSLGVIDTGDMVVVQASDGRGLTTYVDGAASGHSRFGGYGDVIIFRPGGSVDATPIIHRAIIWLERNGSRWDAPSLADYPGEWSVEIGDGCLAMAGLLTLRGVGYASVSVFIDLDSLLPRSGYITMGDFNWRDTLGGRVGHSDQSEGGRCPGALVEPAWVKSRAMAEIPWLGSLKLLLRQDEGAGPVPANSLFWLVASFVTLLSLPFVAEWAWSRARGRG